VARHRRSGRKDAEKEKDGPSLAHVSAGTPAHTPSQYPEHCSSYCSPFGSFELFISLKTMEPAKGIEPPTYGLRNRCSTD
jgi:hypothetical protein